MKLPNIRELIGTRIRELRISKKMKQAELAEMIGIEPRSISRIESGYHFPKDDHLEKFAKALDVEIKDLFSFSHYKDGEELILEINTMLKNAAPEKLIDIYKIIEAILK